MVTITNYTKRQKEDGSTFYVLEVQGGIEMDMSQTTNQFYATSKKAFISSTFDEITCHAIIGTQMQGSITKQECEPYEYTVKGTGEGIILLHRFVTQHRTSKFFILLNIHLRIKTGSLYLSNWLIIVIKRLLSNGVAQPVNLF